MKLTRYRSSASFSEDGLYRYNLKREWEPTTAATRVTFILLNPSTADAEKDDPTIRRCIGYAARWGFHGLIVVNLFALRSTDPRALYNAVDPVGPKNHDNILGASVNSRLVIAAWGNHGRLLDQGNKTVEWLQRLVEIRCLKVSLTGQPAHPLYQRADIESVVYAEKKWR